MKRPYTIEQSIEDFKTYQEWIDDYIEYMKRTMDLHKRIFSFQRDPSLKSKVINRFRQTIKQYKYHYGVDFPAIENINILFEVKL